MIVAAAVAVVELVVVFVPAAPGISVQILHFLLCDFLLTLFSMIKLRKITKTRLNAPVAAASEAESAKLTAPACHHLLPATETKNHFFLKRIK